MVHYSKVHTPVGEFTLYAVEEGVVYIALPQSNSNTAKTWCNQHLAEDTFVESTQWCEDAIAQINEYFSGERQNFTFEYILCTSPFRKKVLEAVATIPYGEVKSYAQIAQLAGNARAVRAAGSANATNPLPLVIPCHRVIASNGGLGGYGGGLKMKQWLLDHELTNERIRFSQH